MFVCVTSCARALPAVIVRNPTCRRALTNYTGDREFGMPTLRTPMQDVRTQSMHMPCILVMPQRSSFFSRQHLLPATCPKPQLGAHQTATVEAAFVGILKGMDVVPKPLLLERGIHRSPLAIQGTAAFKKVQKRRLSIHLELIVALVSASTLRQHMQPQLKQSTHLERVWQGISRVSQAIELSSVATAVNKARIQLAT
jgi:hypothetical protein